MGPKSYQIIFGTKYRYWTIFGSHSVPIMASCSHYMADFHAFLAYFHHLFNTAVTVIIETGTFGVLNLPHT